MDGWMDGWADGCMDERVHGRTGALMVPFGEKSAKSRRKVGEKGNCNCTALRSTSRHRRERVNGHAFISASLWPVGLHVCLNTHGSWLDRAAASRRNCTYMS